MNNEYLIKNSHERSKKFGINKNCNNSKKTATKEKVYKIIENNKNLIEISELYMKMIWETINERYFILILSDKNGCILDIKGDEKVKADFAKYDLKIGVYMDEKNIGTNAIGTAIAEDKPIQVTANEHYIDMFKGLTCSAAPIHDTKGEIIGTLNITGKWEQSHPHTLGLILFAVKAIENELNKLNVQNILMETYNYMESIIGNIDKGLIITDIKGIITKINEQGVKILGGQKANIIGRNVSMIISDWNNIIEELQNNETNITREINIGFTNNIKTMLNIKAVRYEKNIIGMVISLKDKQFSRDTKGEANYSFDDMIGSSDIMNNIITNCKMVANSPSTILIEGESGTGKDILAQAIHNYSIRKNKRFVAINCGAIPDNLIESELFGYEDGAFTGCKKGGKIGKIEMAHGGTLFLDEIGEMPLDQQVNLLRVLQEGKITPLGGGKERSVNVRVIAATNKNLKKEIEKGNFREDLYYRICVIPINLPPLRQRKNDVKQLINYFLRIKSLKLDKRVPELTNNLYNQLLEYKWPGNIRQLENVIENIVNLNGSMSFDLEEDYELKDLPKKTEEIINLDREEIAVDVNLDDIDLSLEAVEKRHISKVLKASNNNICKTANDLGISRNTLYNKINKYHINMS